MSDSSSKAEDYLPDLDTHLDSDEEVNGEDASAANAQYRDASSPISMRSYVDSPPITPPPISTTSSNASSKVDVPPEGAPPPGVFEWYRNIRNVGIAGQDDTFSFAPPSAQEQPKEAGHESSKDFTGPMPPKIGVYDPNVSFSKMFPDSDQEGGGGKMPHISSLERARNLVRDVKLTPPDEGDAPRAAPQAAKGSSRLMSAAVSVLNAPVLTACDARSSLKNLAPKRRWSRNCLDTMAKDDNNLYDYEFDYGDQKLPFSERAKTAAKRLRQSGGTRLVICALLAVAALAAAAMVPLAVRWMQNGADTEGRLPGGSSTSPSDSGASDLKISDEDRYIIMRSKLIEAGVSPRDKLPEWDDHMSYAAEGDGEGQLLGADDTPQHRALLWLAASDPLHLHPDHPRLFQRYTLAVLYHSTFSGNDASPREEREVEADLDATAAWKKRHGWMTGGDECSWAGVSCHANRSTAAEKSPHGESALTLRQDAVSSKGIELPPPGERVLALNLMSNGLRGTVPKELGLALRGLRVLDLSNNEIGGTIPETLGQLQDLVTLDLSENVLQGGIPPDISTLDKLLYLHLNSNHLEGPLPSDIFYTESLKHLRLHSNSFTGTVPPSSSLLWDAVELTLHNNDLTGTIPDDDLSRLASLVLLRLDGNAFTGPLPASTMKLTQLEEFRAGSNKLTGTLPADAFDVTSTLRFLGVSDNRLTGTVPVSLGSAPLLAELLLDGNRLQGTVPSDLGKLSHLREAAFQGNDLTGTMPGEVCDLGLNWLGADCKGEGAAVECDCCECF